MARTKMYPGIELVRLSNLISRLSMNTVRKVKKG